MVATSVRGKKRSLTRSVTSSRLASEAKAPLTRTVIRSGPACITPEGVTAFCSCSEAMIDCWSSPSAAILRAENSRKITSSWAPIMSTRPTFGTDSTARRTNSTSSRSCRIDSPSPVKA